METSINVSLAVPFDELCAIPEEGLRDGSRHPGGVVQFHIRVGDQVTVLFKVVRDAEHVAVAFDHQWLITCFLKAYVEGVLGLKVIQ